MLKKKKKGGTQRGGQANVEEIVAVHEEEVEENQIHIATKNLKRKRVKCLSPGEELGEFM
jgi:hypothetical protein